MAFQASFWSGWEWADPDLAMALASLASGPIYEAMDRPILKKLAALLAQWVSRVDPNSRLYILLLLWLN
jgi:hypothetical protein